MITTGKCYRARHLFRWLLSGTIFFFAFAPALISPSEAADVSADKNGSVDKPLSPAPLYVDIRNGFSILPPPGSVPFRPIDTSIIKQKEDQTSRDVPAPTDWDIIKKPASKELVRFTPTGRDDLPRLIVSLLITREKLSIEQMLQSRCDFWLKYHEQVSIQQKQTGIINNHQAALMTVTWKDHGKDKSLKTIHEALILNENDRYFLLTLTSPTKPAGTSQTGETLMKDITKSFTCMGKTEEDRRWKLARKQAQILLSGLNSEQLKGILQENTLYRISRAGKDIGFLHIAEKVAPAEPDGNKTSNVKNTDVIAGEKPGSGRSIETRFFAFINNAEDGRDFARIQGWLLEPPTANGKNTINPAAPISLRGLISISDDLRTEQCDLQFTSHENHRLGHRQQTHWQGTTLTVKRFDSPAQKEKFSTEKLEVNSEIYLPWLVEGLLSRLTEKKLDQELVFMLYYNRAPCYYSLRTVAQTNIELDEQTIKATYLLGQPGVQGPVIETWIDETGRILRRRCGDIIMERSSPEKIKQLWPK